MSGPGPRRGAAAGWALLGVGVVALLAGFVQLGRAGPAPARPAAAFASGRVKLINSESGTAILHTANLAPGASARGAVTIRNAGGQPGALELARTGLADHPGPNGGELSTALRLKVVDATGGSDAVVYSGPLRGMRARGLGLVESGQARRYRFAATLPEGGAPSSPTSGDNAYAGSNSVFTYRWTMRPAAPRRCETRLGGTPRADRLIGTTGSDRLAAGGGDDFVAARAGSDCLGGGAGADRLVAGAGADRVSGGRGGDTIHGGLGPDLVRGSGGADWIGGGGGADRLYGGLGNDRIRARNGAPGLVDCGPGRHDLAFADRTDTVRGCERVSYRRPARRN